MAMTGTSRNAVWVVVIASMRKIPTNAPIQLGKDPNFVLRGSVAKPCERWNREKGRKGFSRSRRVKAKESREVDGKVDHGGLT
jgi:hypothetical protein